MKLSQMASILGGELVGLDAGISSFSTDTRSIAEGDMFIALSGPNFDANDFVSRAAEAGGAEAAALGAAEDFDEVGARLVEDNAGRRMWEFAVEVDVGDTHISGGAFVDAYTGEIVLFDYASGGNG